VAGFATITEEGKPWVRYVTAHGSEDLTIRFTTALNARKVAHIARNPEVHLVTGIFGPKPTKGTKFLQMEGIAKVVTDKSEREALWIDRFKRIFTGPGDPNFGIIIVTPYRIELYTVVDPDKPEVIEVWEARGQ
jgi:general stress protein 26